MLRPLALAALVLAASSAFADGDPAAGGRLFTECRASHSINEGGHNGVGPKLHGISGRLMASLPNFNHSPAFRAKAAEIGKWDEAHIRLYLDNPAVLVPGTRMACQGFRGNQQQIDDVIAHLHQESGS